MSTRDQLLGGYLSRDVTIGSYTPNSTTDLQFGNTVVSASGNLILTCFYREGAPEITLVHASWDQGRSWSTLAAPSFTWQVACSQDGQIIYGLRYGDVALQKSTNGGTTWSSVGNLSAIATTTYAIVCSADGNNVWVADPSGVFKSTNGGVTFALISGSPPAFLLKASSSGQTMLASDGVEVYHSTNGMTTYTALGLSDRKSIYDLYVSPSGQFRSYFGTSSGGWQFEGSSWYLSESAAGLGFAYDGGLILQTYGDEFTVGLSEAEEITGLLSTYGMSIGNAFATSSKVFTISSYSYFTLADPTVIIGVLP